MYEPELFRLKGELLLMQNGNDAAQAEQSFRTAIEISRRQKGEVVGAARDDQPRRCC